MQFVPANGRPGENSVQNARDVVVLEDTEWVNVVDVAIETDDCAAAVLDTVVDVDAVDEKDMVEELLQLDEVLVEEIVEVLVPVDVVPVAVV